MPKMVYRGQKLMILVMVNTPDKTSKMIPSVPPTVPVKYSVTRIAEIMSLINLSAEDMFFFMFFVFNGLKILRG